MKNIALLVADFSVEHCQDFIKGVLNYYNKLSDVTVFVAQTFFQYDSNGVFDYQYWSSAEVLKSKQIDAFIILSSVYCSIWNKEKLQKIVDSLDGRPVISASIDLERENSWAVINNCKKSYFDIVKHLKEEHGCKKFAFMSANATKSPEALERFEAYKEALAENDLEYNDDLVFEGSFNNVDAEKAILERYSSKEEVKFDALISASDLMATGCKKAFDKIGITVPNDVKIIGFDDAVFASLSTPKLSTINQNIVNQGSKCAEIAYKVLCGEKMDHVIKTDLYPMFRQSCGCVKLDDPSPVFYDVNKNLCSEEGMRGNLLDLYNNEILEKHRYSSLLDLIKAANTIRQMFYNLNFIVDVAMIEDMAICVYDEPIFLNNHEDTHLSNRTEMIMYSGRKNDNKVYKPDLFFDSHKNICPMPAIREEKGVYIVYPIYSGEANYGYIVCKPRKINFSAYTVNLKIIIGALASTLEYTDTIVQRDKLTTANTQLSETNTNLYLQTKTDELTKLLNRRGFMEIGQRAIDIAQELNNSCLVFFADLDGLKTINDTYGHEMGDKAIKLQAEVLKKAFRASDIVGRLSGDEFGIVANSMTLEQLDLMRSKVKKLDDEISLKHDLPFTLSISLGAVDLAHSSILAKLLTEADKCLYEEKKIHHAIRDAKKQN